MSESRDELIEKLRIINERGELELLYGIISDSVKEFDQEKQFQTDANLFKDNILSLMDFISKNEISAYSIALVLVELIHKILMDGNEASAHFEMPSAIKNHVDDIRPYLDTLESLCREPRFRSALCELQKRLSGHSITNVELPSVGLRKELMAWQFCTSRGENDPKYSIAFDKIQEIKSQIATITTERKKVMQICEKYKVSC